MVDDAVPEDLKDAVGQLREAIQKLGNDEGSEAFGNPTYDKYGRTRLMGAANRLIAALQVGLSGDVLLAERFDKGIIRAFARVVGDLAFGDIWSESKAFEVAYEIELAINQQTSKLIRPDSVYRENPSRYKELLRIDHEAESAATGIKQEQHLLSQVARVDEIVNDVEQAAGVVADSELAKAFSDHERAEAESANRFRIGAIAILMGIVAFSTYTAIEIPATLGSSLAHVGIAFSGLAAFAYLSRESAQHRKVARWSAMMAVQLKTLSAFSAGLSEGQRENLRSQFGQRVFSEMPTSGVDTPSNGADFSPTIQAVVDILKSARAN
ncbi:hypothetical protein [Kribbella sp. NPDC051620]|uniref:hypothetical protein n=1 Tax=Kribbella sp. NPDC051620 TaxID=3364120 RepID=UPI003787C802